MKRGLLPVLLVLGALWALLALFLHPDWPLPVRLGSSAAWLALLVLAWRRKSVWIVVFGLAIVRALWAFVTPSAEGDWVPELSRTPQAHILGDQITIENVRNAVYTTPDACEPRWETRRFDLKDLERLDFVVEPFADWRGPAHTFLTFGFKGGEHLAISVETRRERGEAYGPVLGLFRRYELAYVVGDERDLIGLRANVRRHPVYLYPVRAAPGQIRALFVSMLRRAEALEAAPEFYNTLSNTCTTNIVRHLTELTGKPLPFDLRVVLPGYADGLAMEMGLIDAEGSVEALRSRFRINGRSAFGPDWSRQIRQVP